MTDLPAPVAPAAARNRRAEALAAVLADLNRCQHGRHEGDVCSGCGGPSRGNPIPELAQAGARATGGPTVALRQIGWGLDAEPIVVPERTEAHDPVPWRPRRRDRTQVPEPGPLQHVLAVQPGDQPDLLAVECTCGQLDLAAVQPAHLPDLVAEHLHPTDPDALPATPGLRRRGPADPVPPPR